MAVQPKSEAPKPAIQLTYKWASDDRRREIMLNLYCETVAEAIGLKCELEENGAIPTGMVESVDPLVEFEDESEPVQMLAAAPEARELVDPRTNRTVDPRSTRGQQLARQQRQPSRPEPVDDFEGAEIECPDHGTEMRRSSKTKWPQWYCPSRTDEGGYCEWIWTPRGGHKQNIRPATSRRSA